MANERIAGLRTTRFPTERRGGYDRAAVDSHLAELADWLETDEAKAALAQREIELVGERTGAILGTAQESAERITAEARSEAGASLAEAERGATEQRAAADSFASETRASAEADARKVREAAEANATKKIADADEHARLTIREADERLERAAREAEERTAGIETEIAGLVAKRDELIANLEVITAGISAVIEGPGREDLGLPERSRTAAAFTEEPVAHPEVIDAPPIPEEEPASADEDYEEAPTTVEPAVEHPVVDTDERAAEETAPYTPESDTDEETAPHTPEFDTDEELYEDERPPEPVPSGRDPARRKERPPQRDPDEPTTDDQKLTELL